MQSYQSRLQEAPGLPELLAAGFDAFEAIRQCWPAAARTKPRNCSPRS